MPQVDIALAEGRTPSQIRNLVHEVHAAVLRTVGTRPENIRVVVREVPRTHWATGDVTLAETDAVSGTDAVNDTAALATGRLDDSAATGQSANTAPQEQP
ncbi:tautomerase family protein [Streptomyces spirodelae]|uniref:Tautomerase family protein n=1 Tax=Streptomyces spirodelae TaxID=2812904 RepID=A0ABS3WPW3_9ACTN|nr:tautomerase family protein [Streptomyces spirodelae]MBO8185140.1 tautomerase family protein [Streptomyces spirodelae]